MLRYTTNKARHGLVAFYDIWPGNGAGLFLQLQNCMGQMLHKPLTSLLFTSTTLVNIVAENAGGMCVC